jgi:ubiquinone/menaquinone biosynthesis C-methylase UbiE
MELEEYKKMDALETNHWWFVAKRKFLRIVCDIYYPPADRKNLHVLDVGCGTGAIMKEMTTQGFGVVVGIDMSEEALKYCKEKQLQAVQGFADKIPYPDNTFDLVIASDVLEHLQDDARAVQEIYRILKPGGRLIATVPAHQFLWSYHDEALHHVRRYTKNSFAALFKNHFEHSWVSWIHMVILIPACLKRLVMRTKNKKESDVQSNNAMLNACMSVIYFFELTFFRVIRWLPFGLSLLGVAKK